MLTTIVCNHIGSCGNKVGGCAGVTCHSNMRCAFQVEKEIQEVVGSFKGSNSDFKEYLENLKKMAV